MKLAILKASILFNKIGCNPFFPRLVPASDHTPGGGKYVPQRATKSSTQALLCAHTANPPRNHAGGERGTKKRGRAMAVQRAVLGSWVNGLKEAFSK